MVLKCDEMRLQAQHIFGIKDFELRFKKMYAFEKQLCDFKFGK